MAVHELVFAARAAGPAPYAGVELTCTFEGPDGSVLVRPGFWDGGTVWRVRFAPPAAGAWRWRTDCAPAIPGLDGETGTLDADAPDPATTRPGPWRMSPGGRNAVDARGRLVFPVADTAWALPFRATLAEAETYAAVRARQGYDAALLMAVQPDQDARGPEDRAAPSGFGRAFGDLAKGGLDDLRPDYFQHLDRLVGILRAAGIAPIWSPLFFGFGWKGQRVIGPEADPRAAARFARYLAARYGAVPALWLAGADGTGREPAVAAMGAELARWDVGPVGIHYNPWQDDAAHLDADWCAFHLCQTGHGGEHRPERVATMAARLPARGAANGEPTYEGMLGGRAGRGPWQTEEAWGNLLCGGTFGAFYGAATLWQWAREADRADWTDWCAGPRDWREALDLPGASGAPAAGRAVRGQDLVDMVPDREIGRAARAVSTPGRCGLVRLAGGTGDVHPWASSPDWSDEVRAEFLDESSGDVVTERTIRRAEANPWMGVPVQHPAGPGVVRLTPA